MFIEKDPIVSVVIPTYNHAEYLKKALNSVLSQTFNLIEVLVIDNNSSDDTDLVLSSFVDRRLKIIKIDNNGVIAVSRNLGIKKAVGQWIAFLDSDDFWYPNRLETIIQNLDQNEKFDVITTDELKINKATGKKKKLIYGPILGRNQYKSLLFYGNQFSPSATMIRNSFLKENSLQFSEKREFVTVEDYDFWLNILLRKPKVKFLKTVQGEYLLHGKNNSSYRELHDKNRRALLKHHVFNVQDFETNKHKLWQNIIVLDEFILELKQANRNLFTKSTLVIFKLFISSPTFISKWILVRFKLLIYKQIFSHNNIAK